MVTKASGLDKIAESFVNDKAEKSPKAARKPRKVKASKTDERDPAVVAVQQGPCGSCGAVDHGFNDCPNTGSLTHSPTLASHELSAPLTNGKALAARVFFSEDGWLVLPKDLPFEDFEHLVERFGVFHKNMLWIAGDLQAQGEALYGQEYSQVVNLLAGHGYTESTLGIAKSLSEKFPPGERNKDLSWNHHVIVMSMSKKDRHHWLARAAAENLSTRELKAQIAAADGKPAKPKSIKAAPVQEEGPEDADTAEVGGPVPRPVPEQPVEVRNGGVSLEMLERADVADKAWFDALEQSIADFKADGSFDYDGLRGPTRALAAELIDLIKALGDPRSKA
ncbi:MAG: DUF1016 N-terminal domain-containing protein [Dehalococcoidia bacterium]